MGRRQAHITTNFSMGTYNMCRSNYFNINVALGTAFGEFVMEEWGDQALNLDE